MSDMMLPLVSTFDAFDSIAQVTFLDMVAQAQSASDGVAARVGALQALLDQTLGAQANTSTSLAMATVLLAVRNLY